ncbi:DUF3987 domain-containing protein [uncultured Roseovarius sp.]|uniref:DUF3987 domain-containing protein n=1 Tax=uncultured Roseovarius sp. TaxID=293344 RepID=UPI0026284CE5|nr:DUF3987 domain-containing protein [uncultured Roseovarius sp.]
MTKHITAHERNVAASYDDILEEIAGESRTIRKNAEDDQDEDGETEETDRSPSAVEPLDIFGSIDLTGEQVLDATMIPPEIFEYAKDQGRINGINAAAIAIPALGSVGTAIPAGWKVQPKPKNPYWKEPPITWTGLTGDSGVKKTTAIKLGALPLLVLQKEWRAEFEEEMEEYRREFAIWKEACEDVKAQRRELRKEGKAGVKIEMPEKPEAPILKRAFVDDATTEALVAICAENEPGVTMVRDELTALFGSFGAYTGASDKDRAMWLSAYNGDPVTVDRKGAVKDGQPREPLIADPFSVSLMGGIQDKRLADIFKGNTEDGFLARFMIVRGFELPESEDAPNETLVKQYVDVVRTISTKFELMPDTQQTVIFSKQAAAVRRYLKIFTSAMKSMPGVPAGLALHLNKWAGMHARISMVFHFIKCAQSGKWPSSTPVSGSTARQAYRLLTKFLLPEAARVYTEVMGEGDKVMDEGRWIADYILTHGIGKGDDTSKPDNKRERVSVYDLTRVRKGLKNDQATLDQSMKMLEMSAWVRPSEGCSRRDFGKMKWIVNPRVHEIFALRAEKVRAEREAVKAEIAKAATRVRRMRKAVSKAA